MDDWNLPWEARCRCAQVRLRITAPPLLSMACHCTGCQRMSASAFSLSLAIPSAGFLVSRGEPVIGGLHGATCHYFCPHCLSWMFTRPDGVDWFVNLRATLLEDASWVAPFIETYTSEKLPWAGTGAVHGYPRFPPPASFGALMEEYARLGARPARRSA